ncbi:MAG: ligase-associated DNA damage response endonuclease PdeM [Parvibaculales bacterium]
MQQVDVTINGARLIADISGALYWPAAGLLMVADLHFEKGSAYAARGVALPPYDTVETLNRLQAVLARFKPKRLVSLGDSFHDINWQDRMAAADWQRLRDMAAGLEMHWVTGNHDPQPPRDLPGMAHEEWALSYDGDLVLRHEPLARQHVAFSAGEIAGHLHPCGKIRQRGRNLRRRCFVHDEQRLILPAFGALTGNLNVRDAAFADLFVDRNYEAVLLGTARLAPVAGKRLLPDHAG